MEATQTSPLPRHRRETPPIRRPRKVKSSVLQDSGLHSHHRNGSLDSSSSSPSPPPLDLSDVAYTSLRDLIPSTILSTNAACPPCSPTCGGGSAREISIRNHLVKHAAWAYLQPMGSPPSSSQVLFPPIWLRLWSSLWDPFASCLQFLTDRAFPAVADTFRRILRAFHM